jgi:hypothetical protein
MQFTLLYCQHFKFPYSYLPFSISILPVDSPKTCDTLGATETPQINILVRSSLGHDIKTGNNTSTKTCMNDHVFLQAISLHRPMSGLGIAERVRPRPFGILLLTLAHMSASNGYYMGRFPLLWSTSSHAMKTSNTHWSIVGASSTSVLSGY